MKDVALVLAVALALSLNLIVVGLLWLSWRAIRGHTPDTFEGPADAPTRPSYPQRTEA